MAHIRKRVTNRGRRYDVRYRGLEGAERSASFKTRKQAERFAATTEADKVRGAWVDPRHASRPFGAVAEEWFASNPAKRPSTRMTDRSILDRRLLSKLKHHPIGSV